MNAAPLSDDRADGSDLSERLLQHGDALRRLARRLVRDDAEADDLVQETWISVLETARTSEPSAGWRRWLFGVARNLAREKRRSEGRRERREHAVARSEGTSGESAIVEQLETFRMLADELAHLDDPYRSTLYRRFFEGLSHARIAAEDGVAEASVRSRASRGLALLRERLDRRKSDRGSWIVLLKRIAGDEPAPRVIGPALIALCGSVALVVALVALERTWAGGDATHGESSRDAALVPHPSDTAAASTGALTAPWLESAGSARVTLAAVPPDRQPSLRLVDLRTHEPLDGFALRAGVIGGEPGRNLTTRADGSVDLADARGTFDLVLTLIDDPRLDVLRRAHSGSRSFAWTLPPVRFQPGSQACTLAVAVGPRFEIRFTHAPDVPLEALHAELAGSDSGALRSSSRAPLRAPLSATGLPWVRFLDEAAYLGGAPPFRLRVCDETGYLCGAADVSRLVGAQREPVDVALEPRGVLDVRVIDPDGAPCPARVTVLDAGRTPVHAVSGTDGALLRWIPGGAVRVRADVEGREPVLVDARVIADQTMPVDVRVPGAQGVGSIRGRALVRAPAVRFEIENVATHERCETTGTDAAGAADFEFAHVPDGRWTLRAHAAGIWRWSPRDIEVTAPAAGLVLAAIVPADARAIKFRAFDAATGERVDHFQVELQCDAPEGEQARKLTGFGNLVFEAVPAGAPLRWQLVAEGYRTARGDRSSLERDGDIDLVRVNLVRGWEREVVVRDAATRQPLAGARVAVDGIAAGITDGRGVLALERDGPPRRLRVELDGWRLAGGSVEDDGSFATRTMSTIEALLERAR